MTLSTRIREARAGSTPGHWSYSPWHIEEAHAAVRHKDGWIICTTSSDEIARLISLAPEMAQALVAAEALAEMVDRANEHGLIPQPVMNKLKAFRAVMEGE